MKHKGYIISLILASTMILCSCASADAPAADEKEKPAASAQVITVENDIEESSAKAPSLNTTKKKASNTKKASNVKANQPIVWLGDSLTQGSLGGENDNLANAPYERLKARVNVPVEGYGCYAYETSAILWMYVADQWFKQVRDPNKTYIFWVGCNDWANRGATDATTDEVIAEVDNFLTKDGIVIQNYIFIGTTARGEYRDSCRQINKRLKDHYKEHYLDVVDVIGPNGYVADQIHLTQPAYDAVADAVYQKLIQLGYITQ